MTDTVTISAATLTPGSLSASGGVENVTPTSLSAGFNDSNTGALASSFSGTINWGDGNTTPFGSADVTGGSGSYTVGGSHQYTEEGLYNISVAVNDGGGGSTAISGSTNVGDATLSLSGSYSFAATEGQASTQQTVATLTDAAGASSNVADLSATINWGDGNTSAGILVATATPGVYQVQGTHQYGEDGTAAIQVSASDTGGSSVGLTSTASATINDAGLSLAGSFTFSATEGQLSTQQTVATLTDAAGASSDVADLSATINWGDGSTSAGILVATATPGVYQVQGAHLYGEDGTATIQVSASDTGGSSVGLTSTASATINDAGLNLAGSFTFSATEGQLSTQQTVATLTDAAGSYSDINDLSATIDWGDGHTSAGILVATATPGVYQVQGGTNMARKARPPSRSRPATRAAAQSA